MSTPILGLHSIIFTHWEKVESQGEDSILRVTWSMSAF